MRQELREFAPSDFPVQLEPDGEGGGIAYRETLVTFGHPERRLKKIPFSRAIIQDTRIRGCMERALCSSEEDIQETSKLLEDMVGEGVIREVLTTKLMYANAPPAINDLGNNNATLRAFAFDSYEALSNCFDQGIWPDWYIVPYFQSGDDLRQHLHLGVFVAEDFHETVVE